MPGACSCNIAAAFPHLGGLGIISANLRVNTQIIITTDRLVLIGPTTGDLSITAYADSGSYNCPGRAGVSYEWIQRYDCLADKMYFVPKGGDRAYTEGRVSRDISMIPVTNTTGFSASASSGPTTVYLSSSHSDGYEFSYGGRPIAVTGRNTGAGAVGNLVPGDVYLASFTWEQSPPNIPIVSYSFMFAGGTGS